MKRIFKTIVVIFLITTINLTSEAQNVQASEVETSNKEKTEITSETNKIELNTIYSNKFVDEKGYLIKFYIPESGYITISTSKPKVRDDNENMIDLAYFRYDLNKEIDNSLKSIININTRNQKDNSKQNYHNSIGLEKGWYHLKIMGYTDEYQSKIDDYTYKVDFTKNNNYEVESNNNRESATKIPINTKIYGTQYDEYNEDYYKINLTKETKLKILPSLIYDQIAIYPNNSDKYYAAHRNTWKKDSNGVIYYEVILPKGINYIRVDDSGNSSYSFSNIRWN